MQATNNEKNSTATPMGSLLTFRQVHALIGSTCRTGHTARQLAARGQLVAIRLNERVVRYTEASVRELLAGRAPVVSGPKRNRTNEPTTEAGGFAEALATVLAGELACIAARSDLNAGQRAYIENEARRKYAAACRELAATGTLSE